MLSHRMGAAEHLDLLQVSGVALVRAEDGDLLRRVGLFRTVYGFGLEGCRVRGPAGEEPPGCLVQCAVLYFFPKGFFPA